MATYELVPQIAGARGSGQETKKASAPVVSKTTFDKLKAEALEKAEAAKKRLAAANERNKEEPARAATGAALANAGVYVVHKVLDEYAAKNPQGMLAKYEEKVPWVGLVAGGVLGWMGAEKDNMTMLHAGLHVMSHEAGYMHGRSKKTEQGQARIIDAVGVRAPAAATPGAANPAASPGAAVQGASNPYEVGCAPHVAGSCGALEGPAERRAARRQRLVSNMARQVVTEMPESVNGADSLEEHIGELLEGVSEEVGGAIEDALDGNVQAVPLLLLGAQALPHILKALPTLKQLSDEPAKVEAKAIQGGETPGLDALLALEGYQDDLSVEGKKRITMEERRVARAERKLRRVKRKQAQKASKELVKSGALDERLKQQEKMLAAQARQMDELRAALAQKREREMSIQDSAVSSDEWQEAELADLE